MVEDCLKVEWQDRSLFMGFVFETGLLLNKLAMKSGCLHGTVCRTTIEWSEE